MTWYGGFPTAAQLNGTTAPTARTCLSATATGLGHDEYLTVSYTEHPVSPTNRWVPTKANWTSRSCG
jgi:hypothetical protein